LGKVGNAGVLIFIGMADLPPALTYYHTITVYARNNFYYIKKNQKP
jgi:hypothetical protein